MSAQPSSRAQTVVRTVIIWAIVFPLVTVMSTAFAALVPTAPAALRSLLMTAILVPLMVVVIGPLVTAWTQRVFANSSSGKVSS
jgi:antibiotic biosynthesis monooxygenase (ABM) superfamily enzyme